jgi:hypothetical protein
LAEALRNYKMNIILVCKATFPDVPLQGNVEAVFKRVFYLQ